MENRRVLVGYNQNFGRMGSLSASFVCKEEEYKDMLGREIYFGEALGKHSDVTGRLNEDTLTILLKEEDVGEKVMGIIDSAVFTGVASRLFDDYYEQKEQEKENNDKD